MNWMLRKADLAKRLGHADSITENHAYIDSGRSLPDYSGLATYAPLSPHKHVNAYR